jgi:hypothetical protein
MRFLTSILAAVAMIGVPVTAQDYINVREFRNWVGFFAKYRADVERCVGEVQASMESDLFAHVDALYVDQAQELKETYRQAYASYGRGGRGRARAAECNSAAVARAQPLYDQRMAALATFQPPPASQVEADVRLSRDIPNDEPLCIASPPGLKPRPDRGTPMVLSGGGRWQGQRGASVMGTAALQAESADDGTVYAWLDVRVTSSGFKLYGDMTAAVIAADSAGRRVWNPVGIHGLSAFEQRLAMAADNRSDTRRRLAAMLFEPACDVSYLFMKSRFCGMQEDMQRGNVGDSCPGVYRGPDRGGRSALPLETGDFDDFARQLSGRSYEVGEKFEFGAWQGVRIR